MKLTRNRAIPLQDILLAFMLVWVGNMLVPIIAFGVPSTATSYGLVGFAASRFGASIAITAISALGLLYRPARIEAFGIMMVLLFVLTNNEILFPLLGIEP